MLVSIGALLIHQMIFKLLFVVICIYINMYILPVIGRVFANSPGDQGSISGQVIPKTPKMVLDASLPNIQH